MSGDINTRVKEQQVGTNSEFEFLSLTNSEIDYFWKNHK